MITEATINDLPLIIIVMLRVERAPLVAGVLRELIFQRYLKFSYLQKHICSIDSEYSSKIYADRVN